MISHDPTYFNLSIASLARDTSYAYVNSQKEIIYLYSANRMLSLIRKAVDSNMPLLRGAGRSNRDSICCLVEYPAAIWKKENGVWKFYGSGDEADIVDYIKRG